MEQAVFHTRENSVMSDKDGLEAELQGVKTALAELETKYNEGRIDVARYLNCGKNMQPNKRS
jgi:hypothetical protein